MCRNSYIGGAAVGGGVDTTLPSIWHSVRRDALKLANVNPITIHRFNHEHGVHCGSRAIIESVRFQSTAPVLRERSTFRKLLRMNVRPPCTPSLFSRWPVNVANYGTNGQGGWCLVIASQWCTHLLQRRYLGIS